MNKKDCIGQKSAQMGFTEAVTTQIAQKVVATNRPHTAFCVNGPCAGQFFPIVGNYGSLNINDPHNDDFKYHTYTLLGCADETGTVDAIHSSSCLRPKAPQ